MAKYVCDFDLVVKAGEKLCNQSTSLENSINNYKNNLESNLSNWTGEAKNNFSIKSSEQIDNITATIKSYGVLGEYMIKSANAIRDLDDSLANLNI